MTLTRSAYNRLESWLLSGLSLEHRARWTACDVKVRRRILEFA